MTVADNEKVTLGFEAEVKQLLQLMIHSLYSNKEIFLRELVSNASDAADKLRFLALSDDSLYEGDSTLRIRVSFDKDARTITIADNGIGMTREEVQQNIGTIARSGTRHFFESLTGDEARDSQLIGQFGVGFYASFIVADRVTLITRKAGAAADTGVRWESAGEGNYTLESRSVDHHGTSITLHLREGEDEFLDSWRLKSVIRKFSDHISLPIEMLSETPVTDEEGKTTEASVSEWEAINSASALWARNRSDITDDEYTEFYKHVSHDYQAPMARVHSRVEGNNEYTLLLYIPAKAPFDLWERESKRGVKLYVRKVFIMEDADKLMPRYLRFIRGVIDSDSLPLNVSRELLQENQQLQKIRSGAVKKVLGLLEDLVKNDPEKYAEFWKEFGQVLKEGPIEDNENRDRIARLLRFSTTHNDSEIQSVSLDDYIARMKEGQEKIYYVSGENHLAVKNSPHLEIFRKKGIEVLLLSDRVDEWLTGYLSEYEGKSLESIARGDLDLGKVEGSDDSDTPVDTGAHADLLEKLGKALEDRAASVRLSHRLTSSASCLVTDSYGMSRTMERIMKAAGQNMGGGSKPILEINPEHTLVRRLSDESNPVMFNSIAQLLFDQALLSEGGQLDDPAGFVTRLNGVLDTLMDGKSAG